MAGALGREYDRDLAVVHQLRRSPSSSAEWVWSFETCLWASSREMHLALVDGCKS